MAEPRLTRFAVFDRHLGVFGYRILLGSPETGELGPLLQGKKAFVAMTRQLLAAELVKLVSPTQAVVEITAPLDPDAALIERCKELKKRGTLIAVDAATAKRGTVPADIVKVDFGTTDEREQASGVSRYAKPNVKLLADRVESHGELERARKLGYALIQGSFFLKPQEGVQKEIPKFKLNYLRILQKVNEPDIRYEELDGLMRQDLALSMKLLRYVNSAMFALPQKVESIRQAIAMVGISEIRRWACLLALAAMCEDKPQELIVTSLVRARFCEQIGQAAGLTNVDYELFLTGLLSAVDAILDRPILEVLHDLPLSADVKSALLGKKFGHGRVLSLALAYERAEWDVLSIAKDDLPLDLDLLAAFYREAVAWTSQIFVPR